MFKFQGPSFVKLLITLDIGKDELTELKETILSCSLSYFSIVRTTSIFLHSDEVDIKNKVVDKNRRMVSSNRDRMEEW